MEIVTATIAHLPDIAPLFDQYRVFYGQASNLEGAHAFIAQRLQQQDSVILLAQQPTACGFIQMYPSFSSVSMQPIWILNDLFVSPEFRRQGMARLLMTTAADYARTTGAIRIALATQHSNTAAQQLYQQLGYQRDHEFANYTLSLT